MGTGKAFTPETTSDGDVLLDSGAIACAAPTETPAVPGIALPEGSEVVGTESEGERAVEPILETSPGAT